MEATLENNAVLTSRTLYYDHLLDEQMRDRLAKRIAKEKGFTFSQSVEIVDGTIGFLKLCADHPERTFSPSLIVDIGWHEFLMYTREYQEFCQRVAGHFIHHSPTDSGEELEEVIPVKMGTREFMVLHAVPFHISHWQSCKENCCGVGGDRSLNDLRANCNNHCENNGTCNNK